jgi:lipid II:glycine glycyltransferase (peptidoglycan interpeptide bridge formation enzyme)
MTDVAHVLSYEAPNEKPAGSGSERHRPEERKGESVPADERYEVRLLDPVDWLKVAARFGDLTFEQTADYGLAAAARVGAQARFAVVERQGASVAAACVRVKTVPGLGRGIAYIASGPMMLAADMTPPAEETLRGVLAALKAHFVDREGHVLRIRPAAIPSHDMEAVAAAAQSAGFRPTGRVSPYRTVVVSLTDDLQTIHGRMHRQWRRQLRRAGEQGLEVEIGTSPELWARFRHLYAEMRQRKDFADELTPDFYTRLERTDLCTEVVMASRDGFDVAGQVLATCGQSANKLFAATSMAGREFCAGYLIEWRCIERLRMHGVTWFDLGGIDEGSNPGGARYKKRTGGVEVRTAGPFEARRAGPVSALVLGLERFYGLLARRRR